MNAPMNWVLSEYYREVPHEECKKETDTSLALNYCEARAEVVLMPEGVRVVT